MTAPTVSSDVVAHVPFFDVNSIQCRDRLRYRGQAPTIAGTTDPVARHLVWQLVSGEIEASWPDGGDPR